MSLGCWKLDLIEFMYVAYRQKPRSTVPKARRNQDFEADGFVLKRLSLFAAMMVHGNHKEKGKWNLACRHLWHNCLSDKLMYFLVFWMDDLVQQPWAVFRTTQGCWAVFSHCLLKLRCDTNQVLIVIFGSASFGWRSLLSSPGLLLWQPWVPDHCSASVGLNWDEAPRQGFLDHTFMLYCTILPHILAQREVRLQRALVGSI